MPKLLREHLESASPDLLRAMVKTFAAQVEAFRNRLLDSGPYTFVWLDAPVVKVREHGRIINVHTLVAVGVNAARSWVWTSAATRTRPAGWPSSGR